MRDSIKYSDAEKLSFELCPETCPSLDSAFEKISRQSCEETIQKIRNEGVDITDKQVFMVSQLIQGHAWQCMHDLQKVAMHEGTFVLRKAFSDFIESKLIDEGKIKEPGFSNFGAWIERYKRIKKIKSN